MAKTLKTVAREDGRYVLRNRETGEVVDDNQGYGFKTQQGAYKAHWYKTTPHA